MFKIIFSLFFLPSSFCSSDCVSLAYFHFKEESYFLDISKNHSIVSFEEEKEKLCSYLIHLQDEKLLGPRALRLDELECVLGLRQNTIESFLKNKNNCLFNQIITAIDLYYNYFEKIDPIFISKLKLNKQFFSQIMAQNKPIENQKEIDLIIKKMEISVQKKQKLENAVLLISKKNANTYPDLAYSLAVIYDHGLGEFPENSDKTKEETFKWLKVAAQHHNPLALCKLGSHYEKGIFVSVDKNEALKLYELADKQGEKKAKIYALVLKVSIYSERKQKIEKEHISMLKEYCRNYEILYEILVYIYENGLGEFPENSSENEKEKFRWLKTAYENGSKKTIFKLAFCYGMGKGVQQDIQKALMLFQEAAFLGDKKAQMYAVKIIGSRATFENKKMDEKNLFLLKQYATEDEEIPEILSYLYENGLGEFPKGSEETKKEAFKWIEYTYIHRNKTFAFYLAGLYANGKGVQKDMQKALALFQEAAALGHQLSLKYSYLTETEIAIFENKKVRSELISNLKSNYSNDLKACSILAQVYDKGLGEFPEGSNETYQESVEWIKRAKDNGDKNAIVR